METSRILVIRLTLALLVTGLCAHPAAAQTYQRGQNVAPAFEGWERNEDGSFSFLFGYMNRNWLEEVDVPVGEHNAFSPGPADRGQPTHFLPRRNRFVFKVHVPADWGDKELVWALTSNGVTERAYATLRPDYVVDNVVIMSETGALGAGSSNAQMRANQPPTITLEGPEARQATVGVPLGITVLVEDDGLLRSRRRPPPPPPGDRRRLRARRLDLERAADLQPPPAHPAVPDHRAEGQRPVHVVVRVSGRVGRRRHRGGREPRGRREPCDFRPTPGQGVGGHARRGQLALGAAVGASRTPRRRPLDRKRDL